jgi:hypothetical protein
VKDLIPLLKKMIWVIMPIIRRKIKRTIAIMGFSITIEANRLNMKIKPRTAQNTMSLVAIFSLFSSRSLSEPERVES